VAKVMTAKMPIKAGRVVMRTGLGWRSRRRVRHEQGLHRQEWRRRAAAPPHNAASHLFGPLGYRRRRQWRGRCCLSRWLWCREFREERWSRNGAPALAVVAMPRRWLRLQRQWSAMEGDIGQRFLSVLLNSWG
jgi:hypothetical protein